MGKVQIVEDAFGQMKNPITGKSENVRRFTFTNENSVSVQVITYGATITSIRCPDKFGNIADIVLGFDDIDGNECELDIYDFCNRLQTKKFIWKLKRTKNVCHDYFAVIISDLSNGADVCLFIDIIFFSYLFILRFCSFE